MVFGFIFVVRTAVVSIRVESVLVRQILVLVSPTLMPPIVAVMPTTPNERVHCERNGGQDCDSELEHEIPSQKLDWTLGV